VVYGPVELEEAADHPIRVVYDLLDLPRGRFGSFLGFVTLPREVGQVISAKEVVARTMFGNAVRANGPEVEAVPVNDDRFWPAAAASRTSSSSSLLAARTVRFGRFSEADTP
jgi:hypothetical protein